MRPTALSADQLNLLAGVLDTLLPPRAEQGLGGGGELGLGEAVAEQLGEAASAIGGLLDALDAKARAGGAEGGFVALDAEARDALLRSADPELPGLVSGLVFHGYGVYYSDPRVLEALGVPGRPPHPEGYSLESRGLELLDSVRGRTDLCREA